MTVDAAKELLSVVEVSDQGGRIVVRTGSFADMAIGVACCCRAMLEDERFSAHARDKARALLEALMGPEAIQKPCQRVHES